MKNPKPAPQLVEVMTLDEVAAYLKITSRTIYRMLEEGQIPAFKIRGAWRFRKDEIEKVTRGKFARKASSNGKAR
jgi:excisionase family DNA binding protein